MSDDKDYDYDSSSSSNNCETCGSSDSRSSCKDPERRLSRPETPTQSTRSWILIFTNAHGRLDETGLFRMFNPTGPITNITVDHSHRSWPTRALIEFGSKTVAHNDLMRFPGDESVCKTRLQIIFTVVFMRTVPPAFTRYFDLPLVGTLVMFVIVVGVVGPQPRFCRDYA